MMNSTPPMEDIVSAMSAAVYDMNTTSLIDGMCSLACAVDVVTDKATALNPSLLNARSMTSNIIVWPYY